MSLCQILQSPLTQRTTTHSGRTSAFAEDAAARVSNTAPSASVKSFIVISVKGILELLGEIAPSSGDYKKCGEIAPVGRRGTGGNMAAAFCSITSSARASSVGGTPGRVLEIQWR
jgi:hypothetical protein